MGLLAAAAAATRAGGIRGPGGRTVSGAVVGLFAWMTEADLLTARATVPSRPIATVPSCGGRGHRRRGHAEATPTQHPCPKSRSRPDRRGRRLEEAHQSDCGRPRRRSPTGQTALRVRPRKALFRTPRQRPGSPASKCWTVFAERDAARRAVVRPVKRALPRRSPNTTTIRGGTPGAVLRPPGDLGAEPAPAPVLLVEGGQRCVPRRGPVEGPGWRSGPDRATPVASPCSSILTARP